MIPRTALSALVLQRNPGQGLSNVGSCGRPQKPVLRTLLLVALMATHSFFRLEVVAVTGGSIGAVTAKLAR